MRERLNFAILDHHTETRIIRVEAGKVFNVLDELDPRTALDYLQIETDGIIADLLRINDRCASSLSSRLSLISIRLARIAHVRRLVYEALRLSSDG